MSEEMIVKHCAPTLAGIKTGNLFSCPYKSRKMLCDEICSVNRCLVPKGVRVIPLRFSEGHVLIYVYRPARLETDLSSKQATKLLEPLGYTESKCSRCIVRLIERLRECDEFPHEIGLFLSYPPEDVRGFIDNAARNFKCVGCWKVYGDEQQARKQFSRFARCTECYCRKFRQGFDLNRLAVAAG